MREIRVTYRCGQMNQRLKLWEEKKETKASAGDLWWGARAMNESELHERAAWRLSKSE
jgi:hypothetical protein